MRVIAGKFGGRKLVSFKADHIRPTTDRVKESLFNILMEYWDSARVLDLFAGTGNLTIEALSRGASYVELVELNPKSLKIIRENFELFQIKSEARLIKQDVLQYLREYSGPAYDVILIDPPFTEKMAHEVMAALASSQVYNENSVIAIESAKQERLDDHYAPLQRIDTRNYGDKILSIFKKG